MGAPGGGVREVWGADKGVIGGNVGGAQDVHAGDIEGAIDEAEGDGEPVEGLALALNGGLVWERGLGKGRVDDMEQQMRGQRRQRVRQARGRGGKRGQAGRRRPIRRRRLDNDLLVDDHGAASVTCEWILANASRCCTLRKGDVMCDVTNCDRTTGKSPGLLFYYPLYMSERGHKRKRSLQDSTDNLSKIRMALSRLEALKKEVDGIEATEDELHAISEHVLALENILKGAKKPRVTSSTVTSEDLKKAGVTRKRLVFEPAKVDELTKALTTNAKAEITDLHLRIKKIYARVNMDCEPGSRMILDAILLALAEIASLEQRSVAILPEMRVAPGEGVQIAHPVSGYELWLSGNVDYAIIEYEDVSDHRARLLSGGSRDDAFDIAKGRLFLVEAKHQQSFVSHIPEAVSRAIALLKSTKLAEVRFCLSDAQTWMFFILKSENGILTYYESAARRLSRDVVETSDMPLREIMQLVCEWLRPTATGLFTFE
ncbi:hypothetical protein D9615_010293 [Tricholomella constricta]|uniref:Uncharacterized protein n=1 Tax=Tricholomella constricta TaxID=117010 RepID=A0A8H5GLR6_9AGAR|nr:hypothetical protein D9615_010293 [Tricholomella constricta]